MPSFISWAQWYRKVEGSTPPFFQHFIGVGAEVKLVEDLLADLIQVHIRAFEGFDRNAISFTQQTSKMLLRANVGVLKIVASIMGERQHFLQARRVRNFACHLLRTSARLFFQVRTGSFPESDRISGVQ